MKIKRQEHLKNKDKSHEYVTLVVYLRIRDFDHASMNT